jgi:hypothetical protein
MTSALPPVDSVYERLRVSPVFNLLLLALFHSTTTRFNPSSAAVAALVACWAVLPIRNSWIEENMTPAMSTPIRTRALITMGRATPSRRPTMVRIAKPLDENVICDS